MHIKIMAMVAVVVLFCSGHAAAASVLRLAITTSFRDSGLADYLLPEFERQNNIRIDLVAVGSGMALEIARRGDIDALVAHAPPAELEFMAEGWGAHREPIMYNYFLLLGMQGQVQGEYDVISLLRHVAAASLPFVSRGDDSGTHKKELSLWREAGISLERNSWYLSVGQGMAATLRIADQKRAVVLSDSGTWLALKDDLQLQVMVRDDELLKNPYHIIIVDPEKHKHANYDSAQKLLQFLTSKQGQSKIDSYRIAGEQAFYPVE
ncbi:MAG: substrate-binding domain-containing protein [Candidatus Porifericomitaceae bacterium WSBS_2022_MAG_OTU9]